MNIFLDSPPSYIKMCIRDRYVSTFYQEGGNPEFDAGIKEYINTASGALEANGGNDTVAAVSAMGYDAYYCLLYTSRCV